MILIFWKYIYFLTDWSKALCQSGFFAKSGTNGRFNFKVFARTAEFCWHSRKFNDKSYENIHCITPVWTRNFAPSERRIANNCSKIENCSSIWCEFNLNFRKLRKTILASCKWNSNKMLKFFSAYTFHEYLLRSIRLWKLRKLFLRNTKSGRDGNLLQVRIFFSSWFSLYKYLKFLKEFYFPGIDRFQLVKKYADGKVHRWSRPTRSVKYRSFSRFGRYSSKWNFRWDRLENLRSFKQIIY